MSQIALRSLTIFLALLSKRQVEAVCQCLKRILRYLLRLLPEQAVEVGIVKRIHAALERFGIVGAIKKPGRDAQRADPVTGSLGFCWSCKSCCQPSVAKMRTPAL
jgi:hypothetical protein